MNRRQKIIVSVTGIFLVLLILVGLTYAYFLTRIDGNEAEKSISVTTADLAIKYSDNNQVLEVGEALVPGNTVKFKSGETITETKTFTVENTGNDISEYVVIIEGVLNERPETRTRIEPITVTYANTTDKVTAGDVTTFESNDFRYTLKCTNQSDASSCNSVTDMIFPLSGGVMVGNSVPVGETQSYELTMEYVETNTDQSNDMNKIFSARLDIIDIRSINPYSENKSTLAYNIINNAIGLSREEKEAGYAELVSTPPTKPGDEASSLNWENGVEENFEIPSHVRGNLFYSTSSLITEEHYGECTADIEENGECSVTIDDNTYTVYGYGYSDKVGEIITCDMVNSLPEGENYYVWLSNLNNQYTKNYFNGVLKIVDCEGKSLYAEPIVKHERVLTTTSDNYGTSYYYRGKVDNNYVNFAGMCWKIVRINGDGSTKIILADRDYECDKSSITRAGNSIDLNLNEESPQTELSLENIGDESYTKRVLKLNYTNTSSGMFKVFKTYQTTLASKLNENITESSSNEDVINELSKYLENDNWCIESKTYLEENGAFTRIYNPNYYIQINQDVAKYVYYYDSYKRLNNNLNNNSSLSCNGINLTHFDDNGNGILEETDTPMFIGTLTADEVVYAGNSLNADSQDSFSRGIYNYLYSTKNWWTLTTSGLMSAGYYFYFDYLYYLGLGTLKANSSGGEHYRIAVNLKNGIEIESGKGTLSSPYVLKS